METFRIHIKRLLATGMPWPPARLRKFPLAIHAGVKNFNGASMPWTVRAVAKSLFPWKNAGSMPFLLKCYKVETLLGLSHFEVIFIWHFHIAAGLSGTYNQERLSGNYDLWNDDFV